LKLNHFALVCLLVLSMLFTVGFCAAQDAPQPQLSMFDADPSAEQPEASRSQAPDQTPAPAKPSAGQAAPTSDQSQASQADKDKNGQGAATTGTSKDRLFFALPNFLTVDANGKIIPLTVGQKFKVVAQGSFDPAQIVWYAALSGISQAENSEPGYGQGWAAYGKRYAAYAADGTIENFFVGAIMPSILRQDPRFFPKPTGSFFSRASYAASRIIITRGDNGKREFNFSEVVGAALASAISTNTYHPRRAFRGYNSQHMPVYYPSDRTLGNTASVWGSQMGYDAITLVIKEFWPDVRRKVKKPSPAPLQQPTPQ
jgi:hypothetical protein